MQVLEAELPTKEEMKAPRAALTRLADELDRLCVDVAELRPHAMMCWLLASTPTISFETLIGTMDFLDLVRNMLTEMDGPIPQHGTTMIRRALEEAVDAYGALIATMRLRAEQVLPTVDVRRSSAPAPLQAETDPVRLAARELLLAYEGEMQGVGTEPADVKALFEKLRKALDA
jgi:hypothetical protein